MELKSITHAIILTSVCTLTACGGGGGGGGNGVSSSPRTAYSGNENPANLTLDNRDLFLQQTIGMFDQGLISELLEYDEMLLEIAEEMANRGIHSDKGEEECGSYAVTASSGFDSFTADLDYNNCSIDGVNINGRFVGEISYDDYIYSDPEETFISLEFKNFKVNYGSGHIKLKGLETRELSQAEDSHTTKQNLLAEIKLPDDEYEELYHNISYNRTIEKNWKYGGFTSLSGDYYHYEEGKVSLSLEDSTNYNGKVFVLTGANNSTIKVDYVSATNSVEISIDIDGDNIADDTEAMSVPAFITLVEN